MNTARFTYPPFRQQQPKLIDKWHPWGVCHSIFSIYPKLSPSALISSFTFRYAFSNWGSGLLCTMS